MSPLRRRIGLLAVLAWVPWIAPATPNPHGSDTVVVVEIKDAIGPATKEHFLTALEHASTARLRTSCFNCRPQRAHRVNSKLFEC